MMVKQTSISGLFYVELDINEDGRGSFREAFQREKMMALGLPDLKPVQNNISESKRGVIRGIHAEPWEKFIHVPYGEVFSAIVDLRRDQPTFGMVEAFRLNRTNAIYVTRGLGNSFQGLTDLAVYTYLVNDHWRPGNPYPAVAFDDPDLAIQWPVPKEEWIVSEKDLRNPSFKEAYPLT